jgi:hypothetical protein
LNSIERKRLYSIDPLIIFEKLLPADDGNKKEKEEDLLHWKLMEHRFNVKLDELAESAYDKADAKYFGRFKKVFDDLNNNREYIQYVQNGLTNHANHAFYRDMMLEQRIAAIERKLGISPPSTHWLRSLKDDKLNPDMMTAMKNAMNSKYFDPQRRRKSED